MARRYVRWKWKGMLDGNENASGLRQTYHVLPCPHSGLQKDLTNDQKVYNPEALLVQPEVPPPPPLHSRTILESEPLSRYVRHCSP